MPVPQILQLISNSPKMNFVEGDCNPELLTSQLKGVKYSSRYAIALVYECDNENEKEFVQNTINLENGACAKYLYGDSIFRYVSLDSYKRANTPNPIISNMVPMSVVFHTSVPFGIEHVEKTPDEVQPLLLNHIEKLYPSWPKPVAVKCQKWRYSQVQTPYPGEPGCLELMKSPMLLAAGDAFSHSNFDGCIRSAEAVTTKFFEGMQ